MMNSLNNNGGFTVIQASYRPRLRETPSLFHLAEKAMSQLEEAIGQTAEPVTAEWDRGENFALRPVVLLRLSDFSGSVMAVFEPQELEEPNKLRSRLRFLWGDLLQIRSGKLLERLLGAE
jgi:hypothetical protein